MTAGAEFPDTLPTGQVSPGIPNCTTSFSRGLTAMGAEFYTWAIPCLRYIMLSPHFTRTLSPPTVSCGNQAPYPGALDPCSDLPPWDIMVFIAENPSKSASYPQPSGVTAQISGSPLALLLLRPYPGGPGLRPRPCQCLTSALGSRREHRAERTILVLGDSDPSRRDSPGRQLV